MTTVDVLIVGGSVAGLSAAVLLGRCRRDVLVVDAGRPRNRFSHHMNGFLSREGISPAEFLSLSRTQLGKFPNVQLLPGTVRSITRDGEEFLAEADHGSLFRSTIVLLATGIVDELPDLPGIEEFYGRSVHHCPYCDGWEHRDEPIAVYGKGKNGFELARELRIWSDDVIYFNHGEAVPTAERLQLEALGVTVENAKITALVGSGGKLEHIQLADGRRVSRSCLFFQSSQRQNSNLAVKLGCHLEQGLVEGEDGARTGIPGLYVAGNTANGLQLAIIAAADGARAAHLINTELLDRATSRKAPTPKA